MSPYLVAVPTPCTAAPRIPGALVAPAIPGVPVLVLEAKAVRPSSLMHVQTFSRREDQHRHRHHHHHHLDRRGRRFRLTQNWSA